MKKPAPPQSKKRNLSDDDEAVWSHTADSIKPLKRAKGRVHAALEDMDRAVPARVTKASAASEKSPPSKPSAAPPQAKTSVTRPSAPPPLNAFDKRKAKKLGSGQIEIDARIDLHGMRQSEAHGALKSFLFSSVARGCRWVLVITGKGRRVSDEDARRDWTESHREPGVLRRNVPQWLAEPDLRTLIVSFKTASIRHGGEGALYIHLRNKDRTGR